MRKLLVLVGMLSLITVTVWAATVTLTWDQNGAAGYKVYNGVVSRTYTNITDAGSNNLITLTNIPNGIASYFAATAYDSNGLESDFSAEISYTPPNPTNSLPSAVQNFHVLSFK